jgi:peptide/nickel transport system ATP-binding protein
MSDGNLLEIKDLKVHFELKKSGLFGQKAVVHAVDGVSVSVKRGTTFGIVGESGSGKTTTALAVMRLAPITDGSITLGDLSVDELGGEELRLARRRMQIIFQDPYSSLNPRMRAGAIIREPMDLMDIGEPGERDDMVAELLSKVGLRPEQRALFPHQFSGGQRQRIGVARALATQPELVVCDEPVSALDVAIQAQILNLLRKLQDEFGLTYLFISHDLGVVQYMCDEIAVMYLGQVVEQADRISLFTQPLHPYTWALLSAVPSADPKLKERKARVRLQGDPPSPIDLPAGCRFAGRCPFAEPQCRTEVPVLREILKGHRVACHLVGADGTLANEEMRSGG